MYVLYFGLTLPDIEAIRGFDFHTGFVPCCPLDVLYKSNMQLGMN